MPRRNQRVPHKPFVLHISCLDKRKYRSENEAKNIAEIQMLENMSLELSVYKCNECAFWHLTRNVANRK